MQPSDEMVEAAALTLYNRIRGRWGMTRPVGSLEGNQTKLVAEIRDDVRWALAVVYPMIREEVLEATAANKEMADESH